MKAKLLAMALVGAACGALASGLLNPSSTLGRQPARGYFGNYNPTYYYGRQGTGYYRVTPAAPYTFRTYPYYRNYSPVPYGPVYGQTGPLVGGNFGPGMNAPGYNLTPGLSPGYNLSGPRVGAYYAPGASAPGAYAPGTNVGGYNLVGPRLGGGAMPGYNQVGPSVGGSYGPGASPPAYRPLPPRGNYWGF